MYLSAYNYDPSKHCLRICLHSVVAVVVHICGCAGAKVNENKE